jgi:outer membrane protein OmpA-like peptidoglycan-associated protein
MTRLALALLLAVTALLQGCATPVTERIVLLPNEDGRKSAVVITRRAGGSVELDQPYAAAQVSSATVTRVPAVSAEAVQSRYATLLSVQPPRVRSYTLYFEFDRAQLSAESQREVDRILSEAAVVPAAEIDVIGHTDSKGATEYNDNLGRTRAQFVANLMAGRGFERVRISVQSRGEREPLVQTPDGVDEPRNRRVEIRLR